MHQRARIVLSPLLNTIYVTDILQHLNRESLCQAVAKVGLKCAYLCFIKANTLLSTASPKNATYDYKFSFFHAQLSSGTFQHQNSVNRALPKRTRATLAKRWSNISMFDGSGQNILKQANCSSPICDEFIVFD